MLIICKYKRRISDTFRYKYVYHLQEELILVNRKAHTILGLVCFYVGWKPRLRNIALLRGFKHRRSQYRYNNHFSLYIKCFRLSVSPCLCITVA
jgi:hypothetical protein